MLAPAPRLLLVSVAVALPLASLAGMFPNLTTACLTGLAMLAAVAVYDAGAALQRIAGVSLDTPKFIRLTKDVPASFPVTIENRTDAPCHLRLGITLPPGIETDSPVLDVPSAAGASVVDWPCTGRARGDHALREVHLETGSPLGLWLARQPRPLDFAFRVYPNLRDRATAALFLRTANLGMRVRRQVGKGREFENLRHYLPGDSFEDIDWKATARRGFPAVKLYRVEHAQEVYAVLDSSRLSAREGILESFVDAALHLALVAEKQGDRFGLVTFSDRTHKFVRARNGMDHFRLCRETIYNLQAQRVSPDFREVFTSLQLNLRRRSLLVFFTSLDDALLADSFERDIPLLARRHLVLVNVRRTAALHPLYTGEPPRDLDSLYSGLAGQMLWNRMRALQIALQNRGVKLTVTDPGRIKMQVTSGYLDVKRRQAL
jgi:uncharacterized protein (DUF58 family)